VTTKQERIREQIRLQRLWIEQHGRNLSGYVARYGSADDPDHYGDGGELIYEADMKHLRELEARLKK
jgi:hypothetical protein